MASESIEVTVARHGERLEDLEQWRKDHETTQKEEMADIRTKLERPTWSVSLAITALVGLCSTLLTLLVRH